MVLPDEIRRCVVFLTYNSHNGTSSAGTAFFISVPIKKVKKRIFIYLVTAKHVIEGIKKYSTDGKIFVRLNTKKGESQYIETPTNRWIFHPSDDSVDVAVMGWAPNQETFDYLTLSIELFLTDEIIKEEEIGAGDDVFLTGLFSNHCGKMKNLPIIRVGNIAMMPEEKVVTNTLGEIEAYLIEARSIGGLSGSPVFIYTGHLRPKKGNLTLGGRRNLFYFLGVMHGHWDIPVDKVDTTLPDRVREQVNMGIAIVIPSSKVLEIINSKELSAIRDKEEEKKDDKFLKEKSGKDEVEEGVVVEE